MDFRILAIVVICLAASQALPQKTLNSLQEPQGSLTGKLPDGDGVDPKKAKIMKQINKVNDDGSYTFGYEADDGSFRVETRTKDGVVKGKYGYVDATGQLKVMEYTAGEKTESSEIEEQEASPEGPRPGRLAQNQRSQNSSPLPPSRAPRQPSQQTSADQSFAAQTPTAAKVTQVKYSGQGNSENESERADDDDEDENEADDESGTDVNNGQYFRAVPSQSGSGEQGQPQPSPGPAQGQSLSGEGPRYVPTTPGGMNARQFIGQGALPQQYAGGFQPQQFQQQGFPQQVFPQQYQPQRFSSPSPSPVPSQQFQGFQGPQSYRTPLVQQGQPGQRNMSPYSTIPQEQLQQFDENSLSPGPQQFSRIPQRQFLQDPEQYSQNPRQYSPGPQQFSQGQQQFSQGPEQFSQGPQRFSQNPQQFRGAPNVQIQFRGSPQDISGPTEQQEQPQQLFSQEPQPYGGNFPGSGRQLGPQPGGRQLGGPGLRQDPQQQPDDRYTPNISLDGFSEDADEDGYVDQPPGTQPAATTRGGEGTVGSAQAEEKQGQGAQVVSVGPGRTTPGAGGEAYRTQILGPQGVLQGGRVQIAGAQQQPQGQGPFSGPREVTEAEFQQLLQNQQLGGGGGFPQQFLQPGQQQQFGGFPGQFQGGFIPQSQERQRPLPQAQFNGAAGRPRQGGEQQSFLGQQPQNPLLQSQLSPGQGQGQQQFSGFPPQFFSQQQAQQFRPQGQQSFRPQGQQVVGQSGVPQQVSGLSGGSGPGAIPSSVGQEGPQTQQQQQGGLQSGGSPFDFNPSGGLPGQEQFSGEGQDFPGQFQGQSFPGQIQGGFPGQAQGFPGQAQGFPGQGQGFPGQGQGFPGQGQEFSGQPQGFLGQQGFPAQGQGFPGQSQGFPGLSQGFPGQQPQGFPTQGQGFPGQIQGLSQQQGGFPGQQGGLVGYVPGRFPSNSSGRQQQSQIPQQLLVGQGQGVQLGGGQPRPVQPAASSADPSKQLKSAEGSKKSN